MAIFKGSGVALVTPMKEDGSINYEVLGELIEYHIANDTDAIIICGTSGEAPTLDDDEHLEAIRYTIEKTAQRIPVIAGTGSNNTAHAIMMSQEAEKMGADAVLLVTPYYNKATQNGLIRHFTAIANSISIPCILYNVPSRTGTNILPETAVTLAKTVPNIVAIKEASGNFSQVGGLGVISVLANVAPKETHDMVYACLEGRYEEACAIQLKAIPLIDQLFCEVNPIPAKAALNLLGWNCGIPRLPLTEMEAAHQENLARELKAFGCRK